LKRNLYKLQLLWSRQIHHVSTAGHVTGLSCQGRLRHTKWK